MFLVCVYIYIYIYILHIHVGISAAFFGCVFRLRCVCIGVFIGVLFFGCVVFYWCISAALCLHAFSSEAGMIRLESYVYIYICIYTYMYIHIYVYNNNNTNNKASSSSNFSLRAFRTCPLVESGRTAPRRAIRGNSILVNSTSGSFLIRRQRGHPGVVFTACRFEFGESSGGNAVRVEPS